MNPVVLTKKQARLFILQKQGLTGDYKFKGKEGVLKFIRQAGCIQYDPIDVCGKNAELVLQSRVEGFKKDMLFELLYSERKLIDYFDKNLSIMPADDWIYFERIREEYRRGVRGSKEINKVSEAIISIIESNGPVCSKDIGMKEKVDWYWSNTNLSRAALEALYFRGDLIIHHKKGTIKYYALARDYLDKHVLEAEEPFPDENDHLKWRILRRISAVGLLWNKPSDAWLNISNLNAKARSRAFEELMYERKITEVNVDGSPHKFYCISEDIGEIKNILKAPEIKYRTELIAPLDNMMWDRKLIKELFDFEYKWEIYTPESQRKYGYYVLPVLSGESLIGRTEIICDRKNSFLNIKKIWLEKDVKVTDSLKENIDRCFIKFKDFHNMKKIQYDREAFIK